MTDLELKSLYAQGLPREGSRIEADVDVDRLARIAAGEACPRQADIDLLRSDPAAASAYLVARGVRSNAHQLAATTGVGSADAATTRSRPMRAAWPLALAAALALVAVLAGGRMHSQSPQPPATAPSIAIQDLQAGELFSGSFERGVANSDSSERPVIFDGGFDNS